MDAAGVELEALAKREPAAEILSEAEGPVKANLVEAAGVEPASEKVTGSRDYMLIHVHAQALYSPPARFFLCITDYVE